MHTCLYVNEARGSAFTQCDLFNKEYYKQYFLNQKTFCSDSPILRILCCIIVWDLLTGYEQQQTSRGFSLENTGRSKKCSEGRAISFFGKYGSRLSRLASFLLSTCLRTLCTSMTVISLKLKH